MSTSFSCFPISRPSLSQLRSIQLAACIILTLCWLQATRLATDPVLHLGPVLFAPRDASPAPSIDPMELDAVTLPGVELAEVIVRRDDTLEHIFRRLRLSLTDLADV